MNKINILILVFGGAFALTACQTYPKKPAEVSMFAATVPVNKTVPTELQPFIDSEALRRPKIKGDKSSDLNTAVPPTVYVLRNGESPQEVKRAIAAEVAAKEIQSTAQPVVAPTVGTSVAIQAQAQAGESK
jgi:hypothetical protein